MRTYIKDGWVYVVAADKQFFHACSITTARPCQAFIRAYNAVASR